VENAEEETAGRGGLAWRFYRVQMMSSMR
jgi:hypothetical protein